MYAETLLDIAMRHSNALIEKAQNGDETAFNRLVQLWYKRMYNFALKYFSDHDLAMEATQKTFISMHRNINKLQDSDKFRPWLYRIMTNFCREESRRNQGQRFTSDLTLVKQTSEGPETSYRKKELTELLFEAMEVIPNDQRVVVIMKEYEGMKFKEIAEVLDISENTAKSRLYYGLSALKKVLSEKNITKEIYYGI